MKLEPCPFCGSTNIKIDAIPQVAQFYKCERCKAKGPYWTANEGAKEKWNTRATDPLIDELAEKFADHYCNDELLKEMVNAFEEIVRCLSHGLQDCRASVTAKAMLKKYHEQVDKK